MLYKDKHNNPQQITIDYKLVLTRLKKTLAVYEPKYPEITNLKHEINLIYFNIFLVDAHLNHLQKICRLLDKKKTESPVFQELHNRFCADLEGFKRGVTIHQKAEVYF